MIANSTDLTAKQWWITDYIILQFARQLTAAVAAAATTCKNHNCWLPTLLAYLVNAKGHILDEMVKNC